MASSSATSAAAAASAGGTTYQVFLSFRGPDTRQGFTDVLYHALVDAGVRVFRDNEEIRKGEEIGEEILRAIEESKIFVPIFSKGYASSKWCLIEFTRMVELTEGSSGKKIIPIFYDVGVEDVKLKTELYTEALKEHSKKYSAETVKKWEEALRQAGKFKGWELKDRGHAEFAKLVVRDVSMKLEVKHKHMTEYFVERNDQVEALRELLDIESSDVRFVGIYGMGGIGKTTLAKTVFNKICDRFDYTSFLTDVRESSRQYKGIEHLQEQLLRDLGLGSREIRDAEDGTKSIRESLSQKKVLIVLDDVDHRKQILSLARDPSWFGSSSRIIITTRDKEVLEMEPLGSRILEVEVMKPEEARTLFCMHAFKEGAPLDDYLSILPDAVASTGRLPLSLVVIGSHLRGKSYKDWVAIIKRLEKTPHRDVQEKLMISYESLNYSTKEIFLDIACHFIGEYETCPVYMWQACNLDPEMGLEELIDKSLVKIIEKEESFRVKRKTFWMHDQLRDLGREIVHQKSLKDKGKPSRICDDASKMLLHEKEEGLEHIEMLRFNRYEETEDYSFSQKEISSLRELRYLAGYGGNFPGKLTNMLPKLRWLRWSSVPPKMKRKTGIIFRSLVILDLSGSSVDENWSGWGQIGAGCTLKVLDLSGCYCLKKTPDLSSYSSLEMLILYGCSNLVQIDPSIGKLKALKHLDVSVCKSLEGFPEEVCSLYSLQVVLVSSSHNYSREQRRFNMPEMIGDLTSLLIFRVRHVKLPKSIAKLASLCHLSLVGCSGLGVLPDTLGDMKSLVELDLSKTDVAELPETIGQLVKLEVLSLKWCKELKKLPVSIGNLENLRVMNMSRTKIKELPSSFGMLKRLEELVALMTPLEEIPSNTIEGLTCLRVLILRDFPHLRLLPPKLPAGLTNVEISSGTVLERVPEFSDLKNLFRLVLNDGRGHWGTSSKVHPIKLEGIGKLRRLVQLNLDLWNVTCILEEEEFSSLPQLQSLRLGCRNLHHCPPLPSTLSDDLALFGCGGLTKLPPLSNLKNLSTLEFHRCCISGDDTVGGNLGFGALESLTSLSLSYCEIGNNGRDLFHLLPANLQKLHIEHCFSPVLEALPALSHLKNLKELTIRGMDKLVEIPDLGELESLQELHISLCDSLRDRLQNLSKLKMLRRIDIFRCPKFEGIDGVSELESLEFLHISGCACENDIRSFPRKT